MRWTWSDQSGIPITPDGRRLLNIGCGHRFHPLWTNLDLVAADAAHVRAHNLYEGIPFGSETFDIAYHSHFLEHLDRKMALRITGECYRVLRRKGILRVVVPDLEYNARLYLQCLADALNHSGQEGEGVRDRYQWSLINLIDQMVREQPGGEYMRLLTKPDLDMDFVICTTGGTEIRLLREYLLSQESRRRTGRNVRWLSRLRELPMRVVRKAHFQAIRMLTGQRFARLYQVARYGELHKWAYDRYSLHELLTTAGFADVRYYSGGESSIVGWKEYGLEIEPGGEVYKPNSIFAEAVKP